jgi:NAD+ synthase
MPDAIDRYIDELLALDCAAEVARIAAWMRAALRDTLHKRGLVIAISGGIDSALCAALAVQAVGRHKVFGLLMPEKDSASTSTTRGRLVAEGCGIEYLVTDIAPTLEAIGCYHWRDEAMRNALPGYRPDWKSKIVIEGGTEGRINHFRLVAQAPDGHTSEVRLGSRDYLQVVAATSFKQRVRKTLEYFHADRLHYAVVGTPNRLEYDQGFFVRNGDGSADLKPIAHLYKSQVYMLARHLGLPAEVCTAAPSTDTYSLAQGQDEFYFALPHRQMDLALWHHDHGLPAELLAQRLGVAADFAALVYRDIENKRRTTRPLHQPAMRMS